MSIAKSVAVVLATCGGPQMSAVVDPYWDADRWHDAARGDGRSYGGTLYTAAPQPGETQEDVLARAEAWAREYNRAEDVADRHAAQARYDAELAFRPTPARFR